MGWGGRRWAKLGWAAVAALGLAALPAIAATSSFGSAVNTLATVAPLATAPGAALADLPDLPARLNDWLGQAGPATCHLESPAAPGLTVEFARL